MMRKRLAGWCLAGLVVLLALGGCGTTPIGGGASAAPVSYDPIEPLNRAVFAINDVLDTAVVKPVAKAYVEYVHEGIRGVFSNMLGNVTDVWTAFNQLLQGKPKEALGDLSRFVINSTWGFAGVVDIASELKIEKHREDFGQTLGRWGLGAGPYLVMPILGPSSLRDTAGLPLDYAGSLITYIDNNAEYYTAVAVRAVDARAGLLPAEKVLEGAALDKYSFIRDGYLQRRRNLVYDGNPPEEK